jgi:hypothetical protein
MAVKYRSKHLKVVKARGFRLGIGYIPHWKSNPDTKEPISFMVWVGPWIFNFHIEKKGWEPRKWYALSRMIELERAGEQFLDDAHRIWIYRRQHGEDV